MASRSGENPKINQILAATSAGNLQQIKELVKDLDDGNGVEKAIAVIKDSLGRGLFHVAASKGRTSICRYFLEELKFNMDGKDNEALRGLFIIDKKGVIQHSTITNLAIGRSVDETMRTLQALQYVQDNPDEVCPAGWKPGEKSMKPDPKGSKDYLIM